ncbi:MAG: LamG domain-containing protein, partial [Planctomycetales bacterium]|nr:LamG domain-containing protein [Planctomycetales bacterium]
MRSLLVFATIVSLGSSAGLCLAQRQGRAAPKLVAHFPFDETKPGPVADAAGGQPVVRQGQAVGKAGPVGRAYQFAGRGDRVSTGNKTLIPADDDFTILMWIATRQTDQGHLLSNNGGQPNRANLMVSGGQLRWFHQGGVGEVSTNFNVADGRWRQVGVTRIGPEYTLWIDDRAYPIGKSNTPISQAQPWSIGSNALGNGHVFAGLIDDVRVYQGALGAKEIAELAAAGKRDAPGIPAPPKQAPVKPPPRPGEPIPPAFDSRAPLEPLSYNNPGLEVDLGVGLWAFPLPMDFDHDGDLDLVVSCPDKPSNGTYFFENPGGGKLPVFRPGVRISRGTHF